MRLCCRSTQWSAVISPSAENQLCAFRFGTAVCSHLSTEMRSLGRAKCDRCSCTCPYDHPPVPTLLFVSLSPHTLRARHRGLFSLYCGSFTPCARPAGPNSPQSPDGMNDSPVPYSCPSEPRQCAHTYSRPPATRTYIHTHRTCTSRCREYIAQSHLCEFFRISQHLLYIN